jgi:carboxylesterase
VALVNPSVRADQKLIAAVPVLRHLVPSVNGIKGDVAKEGVEEAGYTRVPLHALYSLTRFWKTVQGSLPQVTQPVLLMRSPQDHVVSPENSRIVLSRVSSTDVTEVILERSYHVATLDHDAERIFEGSWEFVRRLAPQAAVDGAGSG